MVGQSVVGGLSIPSAVDGDGGVRLLVNPFKWCFVDASKYLCSLWKLAASIEEETGGAAWCETRVHPVVDARLTRKPACTRIMIHNRPQFTQPRVKTHWGLGLASEVEVFGRRAARLRDSCVPFRFEKSPETPVAACRLLFNGPRDWPAANHVTPPTCVGQSEGRY